ncbi:MAG: DUF4388 domain-containing protein [Polyangiaceae bacterium]|nr:DUF4388 domain-containing protein [Polyangiaceae bacterium]
MREARDELVRIDARGEAHPIGTVASQRMRAREGAYRLLPAPGHVVFMRYTGEDGRRDAEDGAIVRLAGEITAPAAMCDVLALLSQTGWRGELVVLDGESARSVFFANGNVVGAQTTVDDERLGMVLYRFGVISAEQHQLILESMTEARKFGQVAVELGIVTQEQIYKYLARQAEEIVFATLTIGDGTFFFLDGFEDNRLVTHHAVSINALLMDGVTRLDELRYFRQKVPASDYVPYRVEADRGAPTEEFAEVFGLVDGRLSIEELGRHTGKGEFETTKAIYGLLQSKHVGLHPPRLTGGLPAIVATANSGLRTVLQSMDAIGKGTAVREALASFAVGAGVYDILFRGAGPDAYGALNPDIVAQNAELLAAGSDPEHVLKQMLHEYVSFAVFSAGSALSPEREAELGRDVSGFLAILQPQGA